jgi:uncharacterized CHY-type Zn-finger protein
MALREVVFGKKVGPTITCGSCAHKFTVNRFSTERFTECPWCNALIEVLTSP